MNWGDLKKDIRSDLQDTTSKNTDELLYLYLKDAVRDYSVWFPSRVDREELTKIGSGYPLPGKFIEEIYVESPFDTYLTRRLVRPGIMIVSKSGPINYYVQGGLLYLSALNYEENVYLTYFATHPVPESADDDTFVFSIPEMDIELVRIYVKAKLFERIRAKQSSLDRFKPVGTRDDNPIIPEVDNIMEDYVRKINERLGGNTVHLLRNWRR